MKRLDHKRRMISDEPRSRGRPGFTLMETLTALGILALISSGVVEVMDRCMTSAANLTSEMRAFEVAQQQMEQVLAKASVRESADLGTSEQYPSIQWQTTVETFDEPVGGTTWARAVCSSQYEDTGGQVQTVELTCWLARLTQEQLAKLEQQKTHDPNDQVLKGAEAAAEYAGVTVETIQGWLANGLVVTEQGAFIKSNLDLYKRTNGRPSDQEKQQQIRSPEELQSQQPQTPNQAEGAQKGDTGATLPVTRPSDRKSTKAGGQARPRIPDTINPEVMKK